MPVFILRVNYEDGLNTGDSEPITNPSERSSASWVERHYRLYGVRHVYFDQFLAETRIDDASRICSVPSRIFRP
jgi:hypothetical protein